MAHPYAKYSSAKTSARRAKGYQYGGSVGPAKPEPDPREFGGPPPRISTDRSPDTNRPSTTTPNLPPVDRKDKD